ncbi:hypothetical protein NRK67_03420 [Fusobacteria bacterium ZRK30]|nr:hypothetical protein NRK67_03420 [Fusobacteria bacterium ZRK30]
MKNNIIEDIYKISKNEQYWLFRAGEKAKHFDLFYRKKEIGIGWDKINNLSQMRTKDILDREVRVKYPMEEKPGNIINKIHKFYSVMKKGDIIIMPDSEKKRVAFGRLIDDITRVDKIEIMEQKALLSVGEIKEIGKTDPGAINKFRKVKWLKLLPKEELSPKLLLYLFSPHTISILSQNVRYEVNKLLNDIFIIEDKVYLKYKVDTESEVHVDDMRVFFDLVSYAEKIINILEGKEEKFAIKTNVSSPGDIVVGFLVSGVGLAVFNMLFNGGTLTFKTKNIEIKTKGGKTLYDYKEQSHRHEIEKKKLELLEKTLNEKNNRVSDLNIESMKKNLEIKIPKIND